jgi:glycerophosphoryl diester phosphodiesterase
VGDDVIVTRSSVLGFAHRGGMAHRQENTIAAFTTALAMGAPGLETDAWRTVDDEVVLHHDATVGRWPRRRIANLRREELPTYIPSLADVYTACGTKFDLAIDVLDPKAAGAVLAVAIAAGPGAPGHLWLCGTDLDLVASWRSLHRDIHLVLSDANWGRHRYDVAAWCLELRERGVEVLNLNARHCSGTVADACHASGVKLFAWGVERRAQMGRLLGMGIDGLMSDHVDRLVAALAMRH